MSELPKPARPQTFFCNKCGTHGEGRGLPHNRRDGSECGYMPSTSGPYWTEAQIRAVAAEAHAFVPDPNNPGWCKGCTPDDCEGCGNGLPAPLPEPDLKMPSVAADGPDGLAHYYRAGTVRELLAKCSPVRDQKDAPACRHCDDTGDVHTITGEWRGVCSCPAGKELGA